MCYIGDSCKWRLMGVYFSDSLNIIGNVISSEWFIEMMIIFGKVLNKIK